jgi:hypothetical protein
MWGGTGGKSLGDGSNFGFYRIILIHKLVLREALFIFSLSPKFFGQVVPIFVY